MTWIDILIILAIIIFNHFCVLLFHYIGIKICEEKHKITIGELCRCTYDELDSIILYSAFGSMIVIATVLAATLIIIIDPVVSRVVDYIFKLEDTKIVQYVSKKYNKIKNRISNIEI